MVGGVLWAGWFVVVQVSGDVVVRVAWASLLFFFVAGVFLGFAVYLLFPRVMLFCFVALSSTVVLGGRG